MTNEPERFLDKAYTVRTDEETKALYDRWAEVYDDELGENEYRQPARSAKALADRLAPAPGVSVLDVGCGSGLSGIALHDAGFDTVDGCDFSTGMLKKAEQAGIYRRLFEADLNRPPIDAPDGAYDAATCVGVFTTAHVKPDAVDEIVRVIRPGGYLVIGLNDNFYRAGVLTGKLDALEAAGLLAERHDEHGEHIVGTGLTGWVIIAKCV
ncbi:MAG: class I SAM-dependent methyltransferase [Roseitalea sp.]|jgi:predicted TPR repeat methyltransferase|nr:class I SAM-dependent methyltransferase [Roseitalea sp.]MBO6721899.1 class I SAM-dependent methyltransferase [Roseitalea sp.]MBO6743070.1 class I SAM-dependent methyltransferase [Roseitalea sp.]